MTIALISMSRENPETGLPLGLAQLFGTTVADQQLRVGQAMGADMFILLCSSLPNELMQHCDRWRAQGIGVEIVRTGAELAALVPDQEQIVYLGDGIVPGEALAGALADAAPAIYVVENDEQLKEYERIDLTHRWLGVGVFASRHLAALSDIPDDWDIGSALLRAALQDGMRREQVASGQLGEGFLENLIDQQRVTEFQRQVLAGGLEKPGNFLQRHLMQPLRRWALPKMWKRPELAGYTSWASLGLGLISLPMAWIGWTAPALFAVLAGLVAGNVANRVHLFDNLAPKRQILHRIGAFLPAIALLLCTIQATPFFRSNMLMLYGNIVILVALLATLYMSEREKEMGRLDIIRPDSLLVLVILAGSAIFGVFLPGLYTATLLSILMLVINRSQKPENGGNQP